MDVENFRGRKQLRKRHCYRVGDRHLHIGIRNRGEACRYAADAWESCWKTYANIGSCIAVERRIATWCNTGFSAAIKRGADPGKIESRKIDGGVRVSALQEDISNSGLARGIRRPLRHLPMRPHLRVICGQP